MPAFLTAVGSNDAVVEEGEEAAAAADSELPEADAEVADEDADAAAEVLEAADEATDLPGEVYHVSEIINHRDAVNGPGMEYQVKWAGFPMKKDWTWESSKSFCG